MWKTALWVKFGHANIFLRALKLRQITATCISLNWKYQKTASFFFIAAHWCKKKFRRIKIAFGLRSSRITMEIDRALFWYLRNFFGDFTHLNCHSLCYNLKLIITDTFIHFSLNKLQPFVVVVTCFQNVKRNKVATKVKTFKYRPLENSPMSSFRQPWTKPLLKDFEKSAKC